ncbi:MAG: Jag N-terminal domain-containing protein [Myxococcota bacterium]
MTRTLEFEGGSEDEALAKASSETGTSPSDLDYTIIDEGSGGMFGLGARPVRIRVRVYDRDEEEEGVRSRVGPAPEKAAKAREVSQALLKEMRLEGVVEVTDEEENIVVRLLEVDGSTGLQDVLGRSRPPAIPALQFLLNKIVNRFPDDRKHVTVEVPSVPKSLGRAKAEQKGGTRSVTIPSFEELDGSLDEELDRELIRLALHLARRSSELKRVITVHPMTAVERRSIHQTVTQIPGVTTQSEGDGLYRKLQVVPDALAKGGANARKKRRRRRRPRERREGEVQD